MNVKLRVLTAGVLFFVGHTVEAQKKNDTIAKEKKIEEVVILGYSKTATKAKDVTATTTVSGATLENRPNVSFLNSLQGTAPGINIASISGTPGSSKIDVMIRGLGSLNASTEPLYVIDGLITNGNQFRSLNTNDIESISVLKDAAAISIYGNRGANGVVVINTKMGKLNSGLKISYDGTTGIAVLPQNKYNMADAKQHLKLDQIVGYGEGAGMSDADIENYPINTNWRKQFFKPSLTQQHNVSLNFGGSNVSVYSSLGYFNQGGIVPTTNFQRFTFRNNIKGVSNNGRFNYGAQIGLAWSRRNQLDQEVNSNISANVIQNPLHGSLLGLPYLSPGMHVNDSPQDLYNYIVNNGGYAYGNNIFVLEDILKGNTLPSWYDETGVVSSINGSYKLTDYLTINNRFGIDYKVNDRVFARAPWSYLAVAVQNSRGEAFGGSETMSNARDFNFNNVLNLAFEKTFGEHTLNLGAYMDYMKVHYRFKSQFQNGLDPRTYVAGAGTGYVGFSSSTPNSYISTVGASQVNAGTLSYFGTMEYDYAGKYGVTASLRRDGSYRFTDENKWATFWSVGGRWNIDKEAFMQGSTFDMLKLRGSYGTQGNQNIIPAAYGQNPMITGAALIRDLSAVGTGYNNSAGSFFTGSLGNIQLSWEKYAQLNFGLDFRLLNRKLEGSVDYYEKKTTALYSPVNISAITGQYTINGNNGSLKNTGVEAMLRYNILNNSNAKLSIFANGAYNKNVILDLPVEVKDGDLVNVTGGTAYQWNLYHYAGVNPANGNLLFIDRNGNQTESPVQADRQYTGKSYLPKYQGGFGLNADVKGFFLDALFSYQLGAWKNDNNLSWIMDPNAIGDYNVSADLLNAWTPTNTNTDIPSLYAGNAGLSSGSDRFLVDASYLRFKSLTFGYNVNKTLLANTGVSALRIFVQGENLAVWSKWKGYDPEGFTTFPLGNYPNPRTISLGATVDF